MDKITKFPPGTFEAKSRPDQTNEKVSADRSRTIELGSSSSVENLIGHNQDLASRLNVAVGRNIELEKTIARFKKVHAQYEAKFQSAKDQVSLHREKEKFLQNESNILKQKLQTALAHLNQERKKFEQNSKELNDELLTLRPLVQEHRKLKNLVEGEYLPERDLLKQSLEEKDEEVSALEEDKASLLKKLAEASEHIQKIAKDFKQKMDAKEQEFSESIEKLKFKLDDVQSENIVLNDRNRSLRKEQIEKTELLNRIEEIKKEKENNIYQAKEEKDDLLLQLSKLKSDNDKLKIENHNIKKQWAKTQSEYRDFKTKSSSQNDEASSLRALWQEKSNEFSQVSLVNESLKKQIDELDAKLRNVSEMHASTKQRLSFFFNQLDSIKSRQSSNDLKATEAMERAFRKAVEPFSDFDYNL